MAWLAYGLLALGHAMQVLLQDLRLAVRYLWKTPGFTLPTVLTLALGIGATGTVATLADAVLFRPLPIADADRIVHVFQRRSQAPTVPYPLAYADYLDYRAQANSFSILAAHYPTSPMHVIVNGEPVSVTGAVVTASYFEVLSLRPAAGRFFTPAEDRVRGRDAVAVVSHAFWQRHFGGNPQAIGAALTINGTPVTIVGVAPRGFTGVHPRGNATEVWIPAAMFATGYRYCDAFARGCTIVHMIGKLRRGASFSGAQAELDVIARRLEAEYPATNEGCGVVIARARGLGYGPLPDESRQLALFGSAVAVVLLIVCANIAGLLLARAAGRRREIATRLALGATRWRIARQLLTESLVLAVVGGSAGLLFAAWGNGLLETVYAHDGAGRPVAFAITMRSIVVAATAAVSLASAVIFGLVPSIQASRTDVVAAIKADGGWERSGRSRPRRVLATAQVALAVMLVGGAGLLVQSARRLAEGPGVDLDQLVTLRLRPSLIGYTRERAHAYQREVVRGLEAVPGVVSASPAVFLPFGLGDSIVVSADRAAHATRASAGHVGAGYFETLGLALTDGREFTELDGIGTPPVAIVNDVLANRLWPGSRAVGQALWLEGTRHTVVGVVPDAQYYAQGESPRSQVFFSYWQTPENRSFLHDSRMLVRVAGEAAALMPALRRAAAAVDPNVPIGEDQPLRERLASSYRPVRVARTLVGGLALLALVLSAMGVYGVLSFSVAQRTREIGVRMALGAKRSSIFGLVLRDGMAMGSAGAALGVIGAGATSRFIGSLLYGVQGGDGVLLGLAPIPLLATALGASYLPARRAASVPPSQALRAE